MALSADRDTPKRDGEQFEYPCAASKTFYAGALVVLDSSGNAEPATAATGKIAAGVCQEALVSTSAAAENVKVRSGTFRFVNGETITKAHIGDVAYADDDQTIYRTSTGRSAVGVITDVDSLGVWVSVGAPLAAPTAGLLAANNLSDVGTLATAQSNLGLTDGTILARFETLLIDGATTLAAGLNLTSISAALTAHVGSSQGDGAITTTVVNQYGTVANAGDAATLPTAVAGKVVIVANLAATNSMDVFPATGASIGIGSANAAKAVAAGNTYIFLAVSTTQWLAIGAV
mgnify:CR=1 FL=1